jgi:hypothetical protein
MPVLAQHQNALEHQGRLIPAVAPGREQRHVQQRGCVMVRVSISDREFESGGK